MEINITLVLQALQFLCVYYFLYKFLFVPACRILDEQEHVKQNLYKNLEMAQQVKDALLSDYYVKNDAFKTKLLQDIPEQRSELMHESSVSRVVSDHVKKELLPQDRQDIQLFLVQRLSRIIK
jgi:hypothetical protein